MINMAIKRHNKKKGPPKVSFSINPPVVLYIYAGIIAKKNEAITDRYLFFHTFCTMKNTMTELIKPRTIGRTMWTCKSSIPVIFDIKEVRIGTP